MTTRPALDALVAALAAVPAYEDPLAPVTAALAAEHPLTLAAVRRHHDLLHAYIDRAEAQVEAIATVRAACRQVPPTPLPAPPGREPALPLHLHLSLLPGLSPSSPPTRRPPSPAGSEGGVGNRDFSGASLPPFSFLPYAARLAELYEVIFPGRPDLLDEDVSGWTDEEDVVAAAESFLARVGERFPLREDVWDLDVVDWWLHEIPLAPFGFDLWVDGWDDFKEPVSYLLTMGYGHRDADDPGADDFAARYPDHLVPPDLDPFRLVAPLRALDPPHPELAALPDLITMLNHDTGNVWLDVGEYALAESGGGPPWTREAVAWLADEWARAEPVLDGVLALLDWVDATPAGTGARLAAVRDALLAAYERSSD